MEKNKFVLAFEKELNLTENGMKILAEEKLNLIIDVTTDDGFKEARKERAEQNKILANIDRLGIDGKKAIDEARNSLKLRVKSIFEPIVTSFTTEDIKRKAEVARLARLEEDRINAIHEKINSMRNFAVNLSEKSADEIQDIIEAVDNIDVSESFSEFTQEALSAQKDTLSILNDAMSSAIKKKAIEDQQALIARQLIENEEREKSLALKEVARSRLNNLMMIPSTMFGKSSLELQSKIDAISKVIITAEEFCEFAGQAVESKETVISQLNAMLEQVSEIESMQTKNGAVISDHVEAISINAEFDWHKKLEANKEKEPVAINEEIAKPVEQVCDLEFTGNKPSASQLQKNTAAIEAQSAHAPLHVDFLNWSRNYSISSDAFLALEILIKKHTSK